MKINWEIEKKRGNWRPLLTAKISFEDWETELNIKPVYVKTPFPLTTITGDMYYSGNTKRGECDSRPKTWKKFRTISSEEIKVRLPWRPGANPQYPEVPIILKALQRKYEKALMEAID